MKSFSILPGEKVGERVVVLEGAGEVETQTLTEGDFETLTLGVWELVEEGLRDVGGDGETVTHTVTVGVVRMLGVWEAVVEGQREMLVVGDCERENRGERVGAVDRESVREGV